MPNTFCCNKIVEHPEVEKKFYEREIKNLRLWQIYVIVPTRLQVVEKQS